MLWLQKGFKSDEESLKDFHIEIPDNLYTLKPIYDHSSRGVEEFFNEDDYDDEKNINKKM